jgi:hypothetical protein
VLADAKTVRALFDEKLGEVRYGVLTKREVEELRTEADATVRAYKMVFAMLKKGYPDLKLEELDAMPFEVVARLSEVLSERFASFLHRAPKQSLPG